MSSLEQEVKQCLVRAEDALRSAEPDFSGGFLLATANRAYYTCFYCMTALLYTKDIEAKTHQGTRAKFSEHFIKSGIFPTAMSSIAGTLSEKRQEADYDMDVDITNEEAKLLLEKAVKFYQTTLEFLQEWAFETE